MKKILLAGCLAAASALSANAEEENAAENTEVVENEVATDLLSAYDGLNLTIGLVFGSDKVEYNKNARVGQVDSWVVYNKDAADAEVSNTFAHSSDFGSATTFNADTAKYYNEYVKSLKDAIHLDTLTVDAVNAKRGSNNNPKSGYVFGTNAVIVPLTSYNGTKKIASAKSKFAVGGVFGVSYRKIIDNCSKLVAGLNFDLILKGKAKKTHSLGVKGIALSDDSNLYKADATDAIGTTAKALTKNITLSERADLKTMIAHATEADTNKTFQKLAEVENGDSVKDKEIASTALFKVAKVTSGRDDELKKALGVDAGASDYNVLDIAVVDENDSANQKVEHSAFMPMINASLGKVFNIANREMLIEATAGAALVKAKSKMVTKSQCVETKISKIAPTIGFNVSMMITNSIGGGLKANYIFNVKKNDVKVKSNWNAMVYVTIQPKSLNIW